MFTDSSDQRHEMETAMNEPIEFDYDDKTIEESLIRLSAIYSTTKDETFNRISDLLVSDFYTSPTDLEKYASVNDYQHNMIETNHDRFSDERPNEAEIKITKREIHEVVPTGDHILSNNDLETPATNFDERFASTNDVTSGELQNKIQPTKTTGNNNGIILVSTSADHSILFTPGEGLRASVRGRAFPLLKPNTVLDQDVQMNGTTHNATSRSDNRKTNPDIQDIITGFVKLLNGNVQVQVNPHPNLPVNGRPHHPVRTRINNRGPPRITDVPPIEFDSPLPPPPFVLPPSHPSSTRIPPPYPFDIPPSISSLPQQPTKSVLRPFLSGVPLPEEIVNVGSKITTSKPSEQSTQPTRLSIKPKPNTPKKPFESKPEINSSDIIKPPEKSTELFQPVHSVETTKVTSLTESTFKPFKKKDPLSSVNGTKEPIVSTNLRKNTTVVSTTPSSATSTTILNIDISSSITTMNNIFKTNSSSNKTEDIQKTQISSTISPSKVLKTQQPSQTSTVVLPTLTNTTWAETLSPGVSTTSTSTSTAMLESSIQEVPSQETNKPTRWESSVSSTKPQIQTGKY